MPLSPPPEFAGVDQGARVTRIWLQPAIESSSGCVLGIRTLPTKSSGHGLVALKKATQMGSGCVDCLFVMNVDRSCPLVYRTSVRPTSETHDSARSAAPDVLVEPFFFLTPETPTVFHFEQKKPHVTCESRSSASHTTHQQPRRGWRLGQGSKLNPKHKQDPHLD